MQIKKNNSNIQTRQFIYSYLQLALTVFCRQQNFVIISIIIIIIFLLFLASSERKSKDPLQQRTCVVFMCGSIREHIFKHKTEVKHFLFSGVYHQVMFGCTSAPMEQNGDKVKRTRNALRMRH